MSHYDNSILVQSPKSNKNPATRLEWAKAEGSEAMLAHKSWAFHLL